MFPLIAEKSETSFSWMYSFNFPYFMIDDVTNCSGVNVMVLLAKFT